MAPSRGWSIWVGWMLGVSLVWTSSHATGWGQEAKSSPEALILYGDAANIQNNNAFEAAAVEWQKFLKRFPDDPLAARAQHYLGVCQLQLKRYREAADAFAAVIQKYPNSEDLQEAYLNLGWCQFTLGGQEAEGMYAKAAATFSEMVTKFPKGKYTDQALFFRGEAEYKQQKRKEAAAAYAQLVEKHPESKLRTDAIYALGVTYEEMGQYAKAGEVYDLFLRECADSDLATEVRMRKAETVLQAGDYAAAEKMFGAVASVEGFASTDHALFRRAYCLAKLDKFAEAGTLYATLAADHKQSVYAQESVMSAGRCLYRARRFDDAAKWLQAAVDAGGQYAPEAAHWLCRIHLTQKEPQKAVALSARVLPNAAGSKFEVNLKMDQADALYEVPDSKPKALDLYLKIAADHPRHELAPQASYNAAFTALELRKYDDSLNQCDRFLAAFADHELAPDVRYVAASCRLQQGQYGAAEKAFQTLIDQYPEHAEINAWRIRLATAVYLQKRFQDVVDTLLPVAPQLKAKDDVAEAQFLIGVSQFYLEKHGPAVKALRASLAANPKWRQADETLIYLSRALRGQNKLDEAIQTIEKAIADFPESRYLDHAHYRRGEYAYAAADYDAAIAQYDRVVDQWPDSAFAPHAQYGKGWSQFQNKKYAEAIETFTALIDQWADHPLIPDAYFARGMCRRQEGQYAPAVEDIDAFLKSQPDEPAKSDALYERGLAQVAQEQYAAAVASFEQLLKGNAKYANTDKVLYELAWAYKSIGDDAKQADAVARFARLASEFPQSPLAAEAHYHVGESHYEKKEFAEAADAYTAALQKKPNKDVGEKSLHKRGWARYQLKDYETAQTDFAEQLKAYPQGELHADALFMNAECLFHTEKYQQALPAYQATLEADVSSPAMAALARLHGGQCASQLKQWDTAEGLLSQVLKDYPDSAYVPEAYYELGWAKQNAGQLDQAIKDYERAADQSRGPVGARARFMIGEVQFDRKKYDEAILQFQRVMFGYGGDKAAEDVKTWQAKAAFEAGRCSEVQIQSAPPTQRAKRIEDAKRYYRYVVESHPDDPLAAKAKGRLDVLAKL